LSLCTLFKFAPKEARRGNGCKPERNRETLLLLQELLQDKKLKNLCGSHRLGEVSADYDASRTLFVTSRGLEVTEKYEFREEPRVLRVNPTPRVVRKYKLAPAELKAILEKISVPVS
jgi:hypothetical protein